MCLRRRVALGELFLGCHKHAGDGTCGCERRRTAHAAVAASPLGSRRNRPEVMCVLRDRVRAAPTDATRDGEKAVGTSGV
jgi:hypothetical protein